MSGQRGGGSDLGLNDLSTLQMRDLPGFKTRTGWPRGTAIDACAVWPVEKEP